MQVANLADPSVIILLSNAPALQDLSVSAYVSGNVLSTCCLLSQITSLEIKSVTTQITEADLNMAIQGMTSLKLLALSFRGRHVRSPVKASDSSEPCTFVLNTMLM